MYKSGDVVEITGINNGTKELYGANYSMMELIGQEHIITNIYSNGSVCIKGFRWDAADVRYAQGSTKPVKIKKCITATFNPELLDI